MFGIVSMAGNALKAFGNTHPAVKWGVIVLAFLLAAEFVGKEGIALYKDMLTAEVTKAQTESELAHQRMLNGPAASVQELSEASKRRVICNDPVLREKYGNESGCPIN